MWHTQQKKHADQDTTDSTAKPNDRHEADRQTDRQAGRQAGRHTHQVSNTAVVKNMDLVPGVHMVTFTLMS